MSSDKSKGLFTLMVFNFIQVMDIENEIKFSKFAETGKHVTDIDLEDFIKLYVNHRPAFGICNEFMQAIHVLGNCDSKGQLVLQKQELLKMLKDRGLSPCCIIYNILTFHRQQGID